MIETVAMVQHVSAFWRDVSDVVTTIGGIAASVAAIGTWITRSKLLQIKVLVNGHLEKRAQDLLAAQAELKDVTAERDALRAHMTGELPHQTRQG